MTSSSGGPSSTDVMSAQHVVRTYRYLRVSLVALAVGLAVSVLVETVRGDQWLGSISEYFYTPARAVFVGVLFGTAVCLIAIKGRATEDILLNAAGMLAPVVAVVPTPLVQRVGDERERFIPVDAMDSIDNNVTTLLFVAVLALAFAGWTASRRGGTERTSALRGLALAVAMVVVVAAWFGFGSTSFAEYAHYAAAVPLFGLLATVAFLNAKSVARATASTAPMMTNARRASLYRLLAWLMVAAIASAGVFVALQASGVQMWEHWVLVVETALLALFAAFWTLQTIEYWNDGPPRI